MPSYCRPAGSCLPMRGAATCLMLWAGLACLTGLIGCHAQKPATEKAEAPAVAPPPVSVSVAPVEVRAVQRRVAVVGTLHGFERITVTPKVEGRIQSIKFDVGDRVPPNTTLLELDPIDFQLAVEESQCALDQELSKLDLTRSPHGDLDVEQLPTIERAQLLVDNAKRQFERQKQLLATSAAARQNYEQAETDLKVADATLRQARIDVRTTLAAVRQREATLSQAKQKLSETKVNSPALAAAPESSAPAQFVIAKRMASVGEVVRAFPSTPVYELVVDDVLKLHVMVPERYMAQVQLGLDVEVRVEAYPNEMFPGKVARINPTVDSQSRSFDVEAHIPNPEHRLKHGGFAKAEVIVGRASEAITVPLEAVTRFAGVSKVFIIRDELAQEVEITIGTQGPGWVEALGGLHAGDIVVTSGQSRLANGTRVTVREKATETARRE